MTGTVHRLVELTELAALPSQKTHCTHRGGMRLRLNKRNSARAYAEEIRKHIIVTGGKPTNPRLPWDPKGAYSLRQ